MAYNPPKFWLATKRGVGMLMVAVGQAVPLMGAWMGVEVDAATVGQMGVWIAQWFDLTWNIVGAGLWVIGSFFPTAPLKLTRA